MFLFEKSLIGAYWNRVYNLKERQGPFSHYGRINANSADKNLNGTNVNTKACPPNRRTCLPPNSSFLMSQNYHHFGYAINFDYVLSLPLHFQKLRMVVCVIVLSF